MNVAVKEKLQNQKGFTIIEVVLVLAIAGLIFLMVFIALPALQSSQRDTARKNDVSTITSGITSYVSNNRGKFPINSAQVASYATDKSDNTQVVELNKTSGKQDLKVEDEKVTVTQSTKCDTVEAGVAHLAAGTSRQFTVVTRLEGGNGTAYCSQG